MYGQDHPAWNDPSGRNQSSITFSFSSSWRILFLRAVNSGEARSLGLGHGISMTYLIFAGLFVRTTMRSERKTASSTECVTKIIVWSV